MKRISLMRVGGVCAVGYAIGLAALIFLLMASGMAEVEGANQVLPALEEHPAIAATAGWLLVLLPLLLVVSGLSFFRALRQFGSLMWVAAAAFVGGAFLFIYRGFIWLAVTYELAPAYVAASGATRETLAAVSDTLERFAYMADLLGAVLVGGVGTLLFSFAILRSSFAPRWVAWVGVFAAVVGGWFSLLAPVAEVFELISFLGTVAFWVWMVAMGVALWRASEPAGH